jgi:hypothetical protein
MATTTLRHLLGKITQLWTRQIKLCEQRKAKDFGDTAVEIMRYVGQRVNPRRMGMLVDGLPMTADMQNEYLSTLNWAQLFVDVTVPYVCAATPNRLVTAIRPQLPPEISTARQDIVLQQQQADARDRMTCFQLQEVLNWSPRAYDAKKESRMAVSEGLAKGRGVAWLEIDDAPIRSKDGTPYKMPVLRSESVDRLGIDGDCIHYRDAGYIYRQRSLPAYEIARLWGEDADKLRACAKQGVTSQMEESLASVSPLGPVSAGSADATTSDVLTYYEFWSQIGLGEKLVGAPEELKEQEEFSAALEQLGRYVHFAILPGLDRPLGLDPEKLAALSAAVGGGPPAAGGEPAAKPATGNPEASEDVSLAAFLGGAKEREGPVEGDLTDKSLLDVLRSALEWPIKTYGRIYNPWPCAFLDFKPRVDSAWPKAILEAALPLQRFLDVTYETIMSRVRKAGRDVFLYDPAIGEEIVAAIQSRDDLRMVPFAETGKIKETIESMIHLISFPEMNKDIYQVIKMCWDAFREATGITPELLGGMPRTQDRSAKASSMREGGMSRRPDDYAEVVEAWESEKCALEAIGWRMLAEQEFIAALFGEELQEVQGQNGAEINWSAAPLTQAWVTSVHTDDEFAAAAQVNYDIEAGSGKRKNLQLLQQNITQVMQALNNSTMALTMETGNIEPLAILYRKYFEAYQIDMEPYLAALEQTIEQAVAQRQQQAAIGQPTPSGPPGQGPQPQAAAAPEQGPQAGQGGLAPEQAIERLAGRYMMSAGGPHNMPLAQAPETTL